MQAAGELARFGGIWADDAGDTFWHTGFVFLENLSIMRYLAPT